MRLSYDEFNELLAAQFGTEDFAGAVVVYEVNNEYLAAFCDMSRKIAQRYPRQCWFKAGDSKAHRLYDLVVDATNIWSFDSSTGNDGHFYCVDYFDDDDVVKLEKEIQHDV